jgi:hypothetical protein
MSVDIRFFKILEVRASRLNFLFGFENHPLKLRFYGFSKFANRIF